MTKYGNHRITIDGITFDSKKEAKYYGLLLLREKAGEISEIELQPAFKYLSDDETRTIFTYRADFSYREGAETEKRYIDVKSPATAKNSTFILKRKLIEDRFKIKIEIV